MSKYIANRRYVDENVKRNTEEKKREGLSMESIAKQGGGGGNVEMV